MCGMYSLSSSLSFSHAASYGKCDNCTIESWLETLTCCNLYWICVLVPHFLCGNMCTLCLVKNVFVRSVLAMCLVLMVSPVVSSCLCYSTSPECSDVTNAQPVGSRVTLYQFWSFTGVYASLSLDVIYVCSVASLNIVYILLCYFTQSLAMLHPWISTIRHLAVHNFVAIYGLVWMSTSD